ncbi:MAG TPA: extracellular solute-binding protein [Candidatus Limnocylindrales bacterium]
MAEQSLSPQGFGRRGFLRFTAAVGAAAAAPAVLSACGDGEAPGGAGAGKGLPADLLKMPEGQLTELSTDRIPAERQKITLAEFTAPAKDKYDPPIEISTVAIAAPQVEFAAGDNINENIWTRAYESKYGIKVKTLWSVDQSQVEQRTNLMIASGDLPDFFLVDQVQLDQLVRANLVEDLTEVYRKHATDKARAVILESGPIPMQSAAYNGRLMAIPYVVGGRELSPFWYLRKDWLDSRGIAAPKSMQELLSICDTFTAGDTYGLAVQADLSNLTAFFNGYHAYRGIWVEKGGDLAYGSIQPEMKEALRQLQSMYKRGVIHREFGVKKPDQVLADYVSGRVGVLQGTGSAPGGTNALKEQNRGAQIIAVPVVSMDGRPAKPQVSQPEVRGSQNRKGVGGGYWVVRKGYAHPEALLKMLDFWVEAFYNVPNDQIHTAFNDKNRWTLHRGATAWRAYKNADVAKTVTQLLDAKASTDELANYRPEPRIWYNLIKNVIDGEPYNGTEFSAYVGFYGPNSGRAVEDLYRRENRYQLAGFYGAPTATMAQRQSSLDKLEVETLTKIIQGASVDEFDKFVTEWGNIGGTQITKEVNEWRARQ